MNMKSGTIKMNNNKYDKINKAKNDKLKKQNFKYNIKKIVRFFNSTYKICLYK